MSKKHELLKSFHRFLQTNFNKFSRTGPNIHKQRKYEHIEIQHQFEEVEKIRKKQRLSLIEYNKKLKKKLIQQQISYLKGNQGELQNQDLQLEFKKAQDMHQYGQFRSYEEFMQHLIKNQQQIKFSDENQQKIEAAEKEQKETNPEEFEKLKAEEKEKIIKLEIELDKLNTELSQIQETKKDIQLTEQKIEDLEPGYVLITGMQKRIVLNQVAYYEFQHRNLSGCIIHPETIKAIETIHYHVEHNLPVRRELLYEVLPEFFEAEIEQLDKIEQEKIYSKRPRLDSNQTDQVRAVEKDWKPKKLEYFEELKAQEYEMMDLIYKRAIAVATKHGEQIFSKLDQGFHNIEVILENVEARKNSDKDLTDEELDLFNDIQQLKQMNLDYQEMVKLNKVRIAKKQRELYIPEFVKNHPKLSEMWTQKWEEIVKNSFDFSESIFMPETSLSTESQLDKMLSQQKNIDLQELIKKSKEEYQEKIEGTEPIRGRDRVNKDQGLVSKLNILAQAMNDIPEEKRAERIQMFRGPIGNLEAPQEQKILLSEMTKVLYLNNRDPKKYDLQYWAQHFNIEPQKLRNIFNYISYAIPDVTNEKETGRVFRFIYDINSAHN
ncbi:hypothetical protein PPERSA_12306 [Pseudocohnilembus persalinus]|uniref:Uncharacterized protein n=1 Tax=Pseudocohnilembus persalinus TaxID=266149 RepID=A0A0V0R508_PSEPJ|nr:hypothetical protein PPERSA_12306 [Pseudocohnilembus persalinus]|eukprot:KRX09563.1 hypothetical protein PPERSA_12306 [Pseudocohnilembus persalinus]